jgi:ABC-type amino acid transport substrate-binding protein
MADSPMKDKNYNLVSSVENALKTEWQMAEYAQDAEREGDQELVDYFNEVIEGTKRGGERGKQLLAERLQQEGG